MMASKQVSSMEAHMSQTNPYDFNDQDEINIDYVKYFPYRTAEIVKILFSVPEKLVRELRVNLHKQKAYSENKEYCYSNLSNHECFAFLPSNGDDIYVLFHDGVATFGNGYMLL
jgi:hypothetical protein